MSGQDEVSSASRRASISDEETGQAALNWAVGFGVADRVMQETRKRCARRRRLRLAAAAAGLLVGAMLLLVNRQVDEAVQTVSPPVRISSKVSRPERRMLADGSIVELRNDAEITVDFSPALRRVHLRRGEAHFQVAKNAARPFVVMAGGVEARAVGTAFFVQVDRAAVEILVTEGQVAVEKTPAALSSTPAVSALVKAGNRTVVDLHQAAAEAPKVEAVSAPEMEKRLSWRVPRLEFSSAPLSEVIPLFNRHSRTRIVLDDPALGQFQLSGVLRADNTHSLLRILDLQFGIKAEQRGDRIVLYRP